MKVTVDGNTRTSALCSRSAKRTPRACNIHGKSNYKSGQRYFQDFQFAELSTDDRPPQAAKSRIKAFRKLGTIKVTLHRALKIASAASRYKELERRHDVDSVETQSIPEKRLKGRAISVHAALSLPVPTKRGIPIDWEYPYGKEPFAKFLFKYRSRKDLQIEGILPRSPSPVPLEERDPDDLTPQQLREQVRLLRAREEQRIQIKREKRDHSTMADGGRDDDDTIAAGEIRSGKRNRSFRDSGVDVVDLTDD